MADDERPACAGKSFAEHGDVTLTGDYPAYFWHCPACGADGNLAGEAEALGRRMMVLAPLLDKLREQCLDQRAVFLLPSDGATGVMGQFMCRDVIRVPGLAEPMIGIPELKVPVFAERLDHLKSFVADLEQEQGPVSEAELQAVREEWKP